jgi:hypothetical protein
MAWQLAIDQAWISKGSVCVDLKKKKERQCSAPASFSRGEKKLTALSLHSQAGGGKRRWAG